MALYDDLQDTLRAIRSRASGNQPSVGIILGSGLGAFADTLTDVKAVPYGELPNFPASSVAGHAGRLVFGRLGDTPIVAMQGRVHFYEGYSPEQVAFPARVLCMLGIKTLVVTNAAGGINPGFASGDLMVITDHLNLSGWNPLTGPNDSKLGPRFPDLSHAYSQALVDELFRCAEDEKIPLKRGVYAILSGPSYETPAEIRMLGKLGADAVGMSTVPETIAAAHMGVRVAGISCITNLAAGLSKTPLNHEEVSEVANRVQATFTRLLTKFLPAAAKLST